MFSKGLKLCEICMVLLHYLQASQYYKGLIGHFTM